VISSIYDNALYGLGAVEYNYDSSRAELFASGRVDYVTDMSIMFGGCDSLKELDLSYNEKLTIINCTQPSMKTLFMLSTHKVTPVKHENTQIIFSDKISVFIFLCPLFFIRI